MVDVDIDRFFSCARWRVKILGVGELELEFECDMTLREYLGFAYECLTHKGIPKKSQKWEILNFSPEERRVEAKMVESE